jgi:hypothetical protein
MSQVGVTVAGGLSASAPPSAMTAVLEVDEPTERIVFVDQTPGGLRVLGMVDVASERLLVPLRGDYEDDVAAALEELSID